MFELYNRKTDPYEKNNMADREKETAGILFEQVNKMYKEHLNKRKNLKLTRIKINEKIKKELESLGYLY